MTWPYSYPLHSFSSSSSSSFPSLDTLQNFQRECWYVNTCTKTVFTLPSHLISMCTDIPGLTLPQASGKGEEDKQEMEEEETEEGEPIEEMDVEEVCDKKASSSSGGSQKRKTTDSDKPSPKKKKQEILKPSPKTTPTKGGGRPMCKYGVKCYQKNPQHRKKFSHPWVRESGGLLVLLCVTMFIVHAG